MSTKKLTAICIVLITAIIGMIAFKVYSDYAADRKATIEYQQQKLEESKKDKEYAESVAKSYDEEGKKVLEKTNQMESEYKDEADQEYSDASAQASANEASIQSSINAINP